MNHTLTVTRENKEVIPLATTITKNATTITRNESLLHIFNLMNSNEAWHLAVLLLRIQFEFDGWENTNSIFFGIF